MVRGAYGQAGMMADADPVRPYFLKKCRFRMGHWTSQKDGEDLLPWGDLLSLDLSLDCFLQLDRLSLREASAINRASSSSSM